MSICDSRNDRFWKWFTANDKKRRVHTNMQQFQEKLKNDIEHIKKVTRSLLLTKNQEMYMSRARRIQKGIKRKHYQKL